MRIWRIITTLVLLVFMLSAGTAQESNSDQYDESFDPLKLQEPESNFFQEETQREVQRNLSSSSENTIGEEIQGDSQTKGFRVQLVATPNYEVVSDSLMPKIEEEFRYEARAYLVYDSPNYKIRIGDFEVRGEAEKLLDVAQKRGYRYAWIIPSQINPNVNLNP